MRRGVVLLLPFTLVSTVGAAPRVPSRPVLAVSVVGPAARFSSRPIVYASNWAPHFRTSEIYTVGANGGRPHDLTNNEIDDEDPAVSPDGKTIAFARRVRGDFELYLMNADGSAVRRLLHRPGLEGEPAWSPDGRRIAFAAAGGGSTEQLFVVNADGSGLRQLTDGEDAYDEPAWSPDGSRIAAVSVDQGIVVLDADGSNVHSIDPGVGDESDYDPAWSPDGRRIAFTADVSDLNTHDVWVMDADGGNARRLARFGSQPAWSPDGKTIAFVNGPVVKCVRDGCDDQGRPAIATIAASGGRRRFVTRPLARAGGGFIPSGKWESSEGATFFRVSWTPDGDRLVFSRRLEQRSPNLFAVSAAGRYPVRLTGGTGTDITPVVSPHGRRIAFTRYNAAEPAVYTISRNGAHLRRVSAHARSPVWSSDGRRIAFTRVARGSLPYSTIVVVDADGSHRRTIGKGDAASWSPDGQRLAYAQLTRVRRSDHWSLQIAGADGTAPRTVFTTGGRYISSVAWSPVGDQLVFSSTSRGEIGPRHTSRIELLDLASARVRHLTTRHDDYSPVWSPNGSAIAFFRIDKSGNGTTVCVVRARTGWIRCLDSFRSNATMPAWAPSGKRLVYASRRDGDYEIYTIKPDATARRQLTRNVADDAYPSW